MPQYKKELKSGLRWYYKFTYLGITYHSKAMYHTKQEAFKAERLRFREVEESSRNISHNNDMTLLELINLRLDYLKAAKSEKYYIENRHYLKILYDHFANTKVAEIAKGEIQKLLIEQSKYLKKENRDNYAVNALIRAVKALFFYGINYHDMDIKNPCQGIEMFPIKKRVKYIPTDDEIQEVLDKCNDEQRLLVEFVRDTGCRISEALYLRQGDVFDGYVILHTRKSKSGNLMPREAKFDTSKFSLSNNPDDRVFPTWKKPPRLISNITNGKWNWHNLRHRFASTLSKNNTPLFEIMMKLGHNNINTTQNYLQLLP